MAEQTYISSLVPVTCYQCGVVFGLERGLYDQRRADHTDFHCPNGHAQHFIGKSAAERERDEAQRRADQFERQLADLRAALPGEHGAAVERADRWSSNRALLGAFWAGFRARECGKCAEACPYPTHRGGFRYAWFDGFGEVEP